jgi:hypothetical protein
VSGRSFVQRSPTESEMSDFNCEASIIRRPWSSGGGCVMDRNLADWLIYLFTYLCIIYLATDDNRTLRLSENKELPGT